MRKGQNGGRCAAGFRGFRRCKGFKGEGIALRAMSIICRRLAAPFHRLRGPPPPDKQGGGKGVTDFTFPPSIVILNAVKNLGVQGI